MKPQSQSPFLSPSHSLSRTFFAATAPKMVMKRRRPTRRTPMKKRRTTPKQIVTQAGIPGAKAYMAAGFQQPQEIKNIDIVLNSAPATGDWHYAQSAGLANIRVGAASNQRVGRKIRIIAIAVRAVINTSTVTDPNKGQPYTMDLIVDNQTNSAVPPTTAVYSTADRTSLPNSNFQQRFTFLKRVERGPQETANSMVSFVKKCNFVVYYDSDNGLISDVEKNNVLLAFSSDDGTPSVQGILRYMYVDA